MGIRRAVASLAAGEAAKRVAPAAATGAARQFLARAVDGVQGFPGARETAQRHLVAAGDSERAVKAVIEQHVRLAGVGGFLSQVGGLVAMPVTLPGNVAGLAALQLRMAASIAHLRGHDVAAPRVRIAALATLLGDDGVAEAMETGALPRTPRDLALGPRIVEPDVQDRLTAVVAQQLVTRITTKRAGLSLARGVPIVGGTIGAGTDAFHTWRVGRYAESEFTPALQIERGDRLPDQAM